MKARLGKVMNALGASLWFLPSLLALLGIVAAFGLIELDRRLEPASSGVAALLFQGGPEGARAVLSAIASSMMTVTGVTFSITVVSLTLAAQQYTPRVLRQFAADRGNQVVLGTFIATFIYSLLVLRVVRADDAGRFVPHLAVTGGVLLAVASLALLIYFIHHVAAMIQPSNIIRRIAQTTLELIDNLFPEPLGEGAPLEEVPDEKIPDGLGRGVPIPMGQTGYLQAVDEDALMKLAREEDLLIRLERRVGDYVIRGMLLATVWPHQQARPDLVDCVNGCFAFGRDRTMQQDPEYGVLQLSDIGVKALSPGINDPTTAMTSLDFLGALLHQFGGRRIPSPYRKDEDGTLRVIARGTDFERMADLAFSQIRHYGEQDAEVTLQLLRTLCAIAPAVRYHPDRREVLRRHLEEVRAGMERSIQSPAKRRQVEQQLGVTEEALSRSASISSEPCRAQWAA